MVGNLGSYRGNFRNAMERVSLDSGHTDGGVADAKAALDRITIPQDALDRNCRNCVTTVFPDHL